jgi:hypothetical protein
VTTHWLPALLLFSSWIAALATLLVFLETWFTGSGKDRFTPRRASGPYGPVSVFLVMRGPIEGIEKTIRSILNQSYPFIELFLIYFEDDGRHANLAREFRSGSHVQVRLAPISHPVQMQDDRIRALEHSQPLAKGRWYTIVEPGVLLDRLAIESALEFAGAGEISALLLRPGVQCRSFVQRLLAPSTEYAVRTVRILERRRERAKKTDFDAPFFLVNRAAFETVNRMNRMPGILNDSGWTMWGYQMEGLTTADADGARLMWREIGNDGLGEVGDRRLRPPVRRSQLLFALAGIPMAMIPIIGLVYTLSLSQPLRTLPDASILAFSAISYILMSVNYYLYARRLHAAAWFAPFWLLAHIPASIMMLAIMRRGDAHGPSDRSEVIQRAGKV